jgi:uncharacterized damage-inducible protein DinB
MEITAIGPFLEYWERVRGRTLRVAAVIPAERFEEAPRAGGFSCGDLLRHLAAIERYMFAENALGRPSRYPGHGRELAAGQAATMALVGHLHDEAMAMLGTLAPADLQARCTTPGGAAIPVWKWLRAMVEHEAHHRGQIYWILGLFGIATPPLYGLTSEEVRARSASSGAGPATG